MPVCKYCQVPNTTTTCDNLVVKITAPAEFVNEISWILVRRHAKIMGGENDEDSNETITTGRGRERAIREESHEQRDERQETREGQHAESPGYDS